MTGTCFPVRLTLDNHMRCRDVFGDMRGEFGWSKEALLGRKVMGLLAAADDAHAARPFVARIGTPSGRWRWALVEITHRPMDAEWHVTLHGDQTGPWTSQTRAYVGQHDVDTGLLNGTGAVSRIREESLQYGSRVSLATLRVAADDGRSSVAEVAAMLVAPSLHTVAKASFVARLDAVTLMVGYLGMITPHCLIVEAEEVHELIDHDVRHIDACLTVDLNVVFDAMSLLRHTDSLRGQVSGFEMEFMSA